MKINSPEELAMTIAAQFDDLKAEDIVTGSWSFIEGVDKPSSMYITAEDKNGRIYEKRL